MWRIFLQFFFQRFKMYLFKETHIALDSGGCFSILTDKGIIYICISI